MMARPAAEVGATHTFVLSRGFVHLGNHAALIGEDGTRRLFAEVVADPDRPEVRPQEAYQALLSSMQPGWTLRLLQLFWPDPEPRLTFQRQAQTWQSPANEGLDILLQGLSLAVQESPLPFARRTVLEFVLPGEEGTAWWEGLAGLCAGFGLRIRFFAQQEVEELARWVLNPSLEYR
ncbi:MAG: hypothetical protein HY869_06345 [Chloroflexi bacterium]|nr:hypothetical protein [Chloroflexota bacterium]